MRLLAAAFFLSATIGAPAADPWDGEWVTDQGVVTLEQKGTEVTGAYADGGAIEAKAEGRKLTGTWSRGRGSGEIDFELAADGASFKGTWKGGGDGGSWRGWKRDPAAEKARPGDFTGFWLSSWGPLTMELKGRKIQGTYGAQGWATIEGEIRGRRLHIAWKRLEYTGTAVIELTRDGKRFFGMSEGEGAEKWLGLRLPGFERHVRPKPGEVVEGRADNGMLYFLRMPKSWRPGRPVDVVVLLHGSNWTTKGMVHVTAKAHPSIADRFAILGIQGERWADWSELDDLRFNYTYVNWMGKSTYKGYPFTDRESPFLVAQAVDELKKELNFERIFVGGHSQGGFLTYLLHMHYPEKWSGTFPMAGSLVIQAEPDVFKDPKLLQAQRATPMAIVHGTKDDVVRFSAGQYCHDRFLASSFPMLRLFAPDLGHAYDFLPVGEVIEWLDAMSAPNLTALAAHAKKWAMAGEWRDVAAALRRAKLLKAESKLAEAAQLLNAAAAKDAPAHLEAIRANKDATWIDPYLAWQDRFEFASAAGVAVAAYGEVQNSHDPKAEELIGKARKAFQAGNRDEGWALYEEIVAKWYAAKRYRLVKRWLSEKK